MLHNVLDTTPTRWSADLINIYKRAFCASPCFVCFVLEDPLLRHPLFCCRFVCLLIETPAILAYRENVYQLPY